MSIFSMIDTLTFSERLIHAGMSPEIAKELAKAHKEAFDESLAGTVATKVELSQTENNLKVEIIRVETDLRQDIIRVETDLRQDVARLEMNLKQDIQQLKSSDVLIKWMMGFLLTINMAILAKMFV